MGVTAVTANLSTVAAAARGRTPTSDEALLCRANQCLVSTRTSDCDSVAYQQTALEYQM